MQRWTTFYTSPKSTNELVIQLAGSETRARDSTHRPESRAIQIVLSSCKLSPSILSLTAVNELASTLTITIGAVDRVAAHLTRWSQSVARAHYKKADSETTRRVRSKELESLRCRASTNLKVLKLKAASQR